MFKVKTKNLGSFDIAVCGGGVAGAAAAIAAAREGARVVLIERAGSLGGTLTEGFMPILHDAQNKGGIVKELFDFLDAHDMTVARHGSPVDESGKRIPGIMVDTEGCKIFFDEECEKAGVKLLYHSQIVAIEMEEDEIKRLLVSTDCGNYSLSAKIFIDATGNGSIADMAGCKWECGDPHEGRPSPASMSLCTIGMPPEYNGPENEAEKTEYANMLAEYGIHFSAQQMSSRKLPSLQSWSTGLNFEYDVRPDDIHSLTRAVVHGRREVFDTIEQHKRIEGFEKLWVAFTNAHIGIREGRRIYGEYRLTDEDILEGRRFEDGICLVTFGVDVHKLKADDTTDCKRGYRAKPYNIPYRTLIPLGVKNLMLAGRCISGDFYPHASYRVMGNMLATGEAGGYAAAKCIKENILPRDFDGKRAREFMISKGYKM